MASSFFLQAEVETRANKGNILSYGPSSFLFVNGHKFNALKRTASFDYFFFFSRGSVFP